MAGEAEVQRPCYRSASFFEEYIKYSKLARSVYERYTDQVEPYGMDECWLDISGTSGIFGSPEKVANETVRRLSLNWV